jgi:copper chaperone CopZ
MKISSYSHVTPGRLRVKIPQVTNSEVNAQKVERLLKSIAGVNSVRANPLTGNALVFFDSKSLTHKDVIEILVMHDYLKRKSKDSRRPRRASVEQILSPEFVGKAVADVVLQTAVEFAVKRALLALV